MKNTTEQTTERKLVKVERHFGGLHTTYHYSDGTTCNVYENGYRSNSDRITKNFSEPTNNTMKNKTTKSTAKKASASNKKTVKKVDPAAAPAEAAATPAPVASNKLSRADVKAAVENFLKNPPDKPLTLAEVYATIGFAHRQVYMMVREHGVAAGKADRTGKGRKETLFTFTKTA